MGLLLSFFLLIGHTYIDDWLFLNLIFLKQMCLVPLDTVGYAGHLIGLIEITQNLEETYAFYDRQLDIRQNTLYWKRLYVV